MASPATVSRCGMIYVEPQEIGFRPVIASYLEKLPDAMNAESKELLADLYDWLVPASIKFHRKNCKEVSATLDQTLVISLNRIFSCLTEVFVDTPEKVAEMDEKALATFVETCFTFALVWSIGISVDIEGRAKFDAFYRDLLAGKVEASPPPPKRKIQNSFPERGMVYDYVWDLEMGKWQAWKDRIDAKPVIDKEAKFTEIIVPTVDTCRYAWILELLVLRQHPILFVGPTGTGKSAYTTTKLMLGMPEEYTFMTVAFSARTSANQTQDIIDGKLDKRRKGIFGPPAQKKMVSDLPCNIRREGGQSLVIGGQPLVMLEGKACNPL